MLKVTKNAAKQILESAEQGENDGLPLRIAARRADDGSIQYAIGFDSRRDGDLHFDSKGVDIVIDETGKALLQGTTVDYVEMEPGQFSFIFLNPNDPNFVPPTEED